MAAVTFCKQPALGLRDSSRPVGRRRRPGPDGAPVRPVDRARACTQSRRGGAPYREHRVRARERMGSVRHRAARPRRRPGAVARVGPQAAGRRRAECDAAHDLRAHRAARQRARGARARGALRPDHALRLHAVRVRRTPEGRYRDVRPRDPRCTVGAAPPEDDAVEGNLGEHLQRRRAGAADHRARRVPDRHRAQLPFCTAAADVRREPLHREHPRAVGDPRAGPVLSAILVAGRSARRSPRRSA